MYVQGVSTRKVKAITEELCGHRLSASTVSRINRSLGGLLRRFAQRRLEEAYPYVILDARYEKVRLDGVIQSQAVFIALGINGEGRRQVLGGELANRESQSSWLLGVSASGFYAWARRLSARISCERWPPILVVLWIAWCGVKEMVVAASGGTDSSHDSLRFPAGVHRKNRFRFPRVPASYRRGTSSQRRGNRWNR